MSIRSICHCQLRRVRANKKKKQKEKKKKKKSFGFFAALLTEAPFNKRSNEPSCSSNTQNETQNSREKKKKKNVILSIFSI
jgi:alkaline phosphatase